MRREILGSLKRGTVGIEIEGEENKKREKCVNSVRSIYLIVPE